MPARKQPHEFTACEQFGLRYSATGKLVKISDPEARGKEAITYTNCLDIFDLAEALDLSLTEERAQEEAERIYENRKQFYNNHGYMKKKAIGEAYDGPVFSDDSLYRRSNGEKYAVRPDGSLESKAGKIIKEPNFEGFVHTFPRKHERTATFKEGRPRKDAAPVLTLPKQDNPLVEGECKTRTPEEASRSAAKQREQARKEAAKTTALDEMVVNKCLEYHKENPSLTPMEVAEKMATEAEKQVREHYQEKEEEAKREVANFLQRRFIHFCEEVAAGRGEAPEICEFRKYASKEILAYIPHDMLIHELRGRGKDTPSGKLLQAYTDKEVADELRRRGYTVNATKTVEI